MKTLDDLKNKRSKHADMFTHDGREIKFHAKTNLIFAHYKLFPLNSFGTTSSKKRAIKYLETGL